MITCWFVRPKHVNNVFGIKLDYRVKKSAQGL